MNVYELFRDKSEIIKSVGVEYSKLDYNSLLLILINNFKIFNMLDVNSSIITNDPKFYELLFSIKYETKYQDMYQLDAILLSLNAIEARTLIQLYGSNKAKDSIYNPIFSKDILYNILMHQTDLDTIINLYNTSKEIRSLLDDPKILQQIMLNIYYRLEPLHTSLIVHPKYYIKNDLNTDNNITKSEIKSLDFEGFIRWYIDNYYTKYCNNEDLFTCYIGAKDNNDLEMISREYSIILKHPYWYKNTLEYIPPRYLLELINSTNINLDDIYDIVTGSLKEYARNYKLNDSDIEAYSQMLTIIKEVIDDEEGLAELMLTPINDIKLFKIIYDILIKGRGDEINIFKIIESSMERLGMSIRNSFMQYEFIKCIEYTLGGEYVHSIIKDYWEDTLRQNIEEFYDDYIYMSDQEDSIEEHLVEMFDILKKYVNDDKFKDVLNSMISDLNEKPYSIIFNVINNYLKT